jgi:hypothetical protein
LAEKYIRKLFLESTPEDHFREFVGMNYSEYVTKSKEFEKNVTIGVIKKENQEKRLTFLKEKSIHYIPLVEDRKSKVYQTEYLLITKSSQTEAELRKVKQPPIEMTRDELKATGITWDLTQGVKKYLVFYLENIEDVFDITSDVIPINFRYTTLRGLNIFKKELNSKALYLTNESSYKLYTTLQKKGIEFKIKWPKKTEDKTLVIFNLAIGLEVKSSDLFSYLEYQFKGKLITFSHLMDEINFIRDKKSMSVI